MDSSSQKTLRRVERNDTELTTLNISDNFYDDDGIFNSRDGNDFLGLVRVSG